MITCYLQGGLGAQMHQMSTAINLALENDDEAAFSKNAHHLPLQGNKIFNYTDNIFSDLTVVDDLKVENFYKEVGHTYSSIPYQENLCLKGYFQSEKYFAENRDHILSLFQPSEEDVEDLLGDYSDIQGNACVHVRRGDYLKFPDVHPVCPVEYYEKASKKFPSGLDYYVFSDDIEWCKKNLDFLPGATFVSGNKDYEDIFLMSLCDYHITANSSFSWWGAQLADEGNVIVPHESMWFGSKGPSEHDIIPDRWGEVYA